MGLYMDLEVKTNLEDGKKEQSKAPSAARDEIPWEYGKQPEKIENRDQPKEVEK